MSKTSNSINTPSMTPSTGQASNSNKNAIEEDHKDRKFVADPEPLMGLRKMKSKLPAYPTFG